MTITMRRGKGARFRGPYSVPSILNRLHASMLTKRLSAANSMTNKLFPNSLEIRETIRSTLHTINPRLALPSVRKGAVQFLSDSGMQESLLMRMTGHKK